MYDPDICRMKDMAIILCGGATRRPVKVTAAAVSLLLMCVWIEGDAQDPGERLYLFIHSMDDRLVMKESVRVSQKVTIVYNHSVEKVPVLEVYEVRGEGT